MHCVIGRQHDATVALMAQDAAHTLRRCSASSTPRHPLGIPAYDATGSMQCESWTQAACLGPGARLQSTVQPAWHIGPATPAGVCHFQHPRRSLVALFVGALGCNSNIGLCGPTSAHRSKLRSCRARCKACGTMHAARADACDGRLAKTRVRACSSRRAKRRERAPHNPASRTCEREAACQQLCTARTCPRLVISALESGELRRLTNCSLFTSHSHSQAPHLVRTQERQNWRDPTMLG